MNILVTGANGQLGNEMRIIAKSSGDNYFFTDVNEVEGVETTYLDISDLKAVMYMVAECRIDAIVNCAAYTNVDAAESKGNEGGKWLAGTNIDGLCLWKRAIQCTLPRGSTRNTHRSLWHD